MPAEEKKEKPIEKPRVEGESASAVDPATSPTAGVHESPDGPATLQLTAFYQESKGRSLAEVVRHGREVVQASKFNAVKPEPVAGNLGQGHKSLYDIFKAAHGPTVGQVVPAEDGTPGKEPALAEDGAKPNIQPHVLELIKRAGQLAGAGAEPADDAVAAATPKPAVVQVGVSTSTPSPAVAGKVVWQSETATPDDDDDDDDSKVKHTTWTESMANYSAGQLADILRTAEDPAQRQAAANLLPRSTWQVNPDVIPTLLAALSRDGAAVVRIECLRSLARMKANFPQVKAAVGALRNDGDARIRYEAVHTLMALSR